MYKVHIGYTPKGRNKWLKFTTLQEANLFCEDVRKKTRIILTVIKGV